MNRNFWLLTSAQVISMLGTYAGQLAQGWLVYDLTGSKLAMGTMFLLFMVPELVLRLLGGPLVDRTNRLRLMMWLDVAQALVYAMPPLLAATGHAKLGYLYAFAVLGGLTRALYLPASFSLLPAIVPADKLTRANSVSQSLITGAGLLGPAVGGLLVANMGAVPALSLDAASYALSALTLFLLPKAVGMVAKQAGPTVSYGKQLADGLRFYKQVPALLVLTTLAATINLVIAGVNNMMVPLAVEFLHAGAKTAGAMVTVFSVGMIAGSSALGLIGEVRRRRLVIGATNALAGGAVIGMGLLKPGSVVAAMVLWGLVGLATGTYNPIAAMLYQRLVPDALRGRVMAVRTTVAFGSMPLGAFLGAMIATQASLSTMLFVLGLVPVVAALTAMQTRASRGIDGDLSQNRGAAAVPVAAR